MNQLNNKRAEKSHNKINYYIVDWAETNRNFQFVYVSIRSNAYCLLWVKRARFPRWLCRFSPRAVCVIMYCIVYLLLSSFTRTSGPHGSFCWLLPFDAHYVNGVHMFIVPSHGRSLLAIDIRLLSKMYINFNLNNVLSLHTHTRAHTHVLAHSQAVANH